jgi:hypothetical protein
LQLCLEDYLMQQMQFLPGEGFETKYSITSLHVPWRSGH